MKKKDIILVIVILLFAVGGLLAYRFFTKTPDKDTAEVVITVNGSEFGRYPLNEDQTVEIPAGYGTSTLEIKEGKAKMVHAGCPDQICVGHAAISESYDMIVCIPNQILVQVQGGEEPEVDSLAQ